MLSRVMLLRLSASMNSQSIIAVCHSDTRSSLGGPLDAPGRKAPTAPQNFVRPSSVAYSSRNFLVRPVPQSCTQDPESSMTPILHGLCTLGIAILSIARIYEEHREDIRGCSIRFAKPCFPDDRLTMRIWRTSSGRSPSAPRGRRARSSCRPEACKSFHQPRRGRYEQHRRSGR